jgi:hypothetical protein
MIYLTAEANLYVSLSGSDANDGSVNSPWRTPQHAADELHRNYDLCGFPITISVGPGQYGPLVLSGPFRGVASRSGVNFVGTQSHNVVSDTGFVAGDGCNALTAMDGAQATLSGFYTQATGGGTYGRGIICHNLSSLQLNWWEHRACSQSHVLAGGGGIVNLGGTHMLTGAAPIFMLAEDMGIAYLSGDLWIVNTMTFSTAAAVADRGGLVDFSYTTVSPIGGAVAHGVKYNANTLGKVVGSYAGGIGIPGDQAGITATGGIYI